MFNIIAMITLLSKIMTASGEMTSIGSFFLGGCGDGVGGCMLTCRIYFTCFLGLEAVHVPMKQKKKVKLLFLLKYSLTSLVLPSPRH